MSNADSRKGRPFVVLGGPSLDDPRLDLENVVLGDRAAATWTNWKANGTPYFPPQIGTIASRIPNAGHGPDPSVAS